jgi:hypothetical protein
MRIGSRDTRAEEEDEAEYQRLLRRDKAKVAQLEADALAWRCPDFIEDTGA